MLPAVLWPGNSVLEQHCSPLVDHCLHLQPSCRPPMTKVYETLVSIARENSELAERETFAALDQLRSWTDSAVHDCLAATTQGRARRGGHVQRQVNHEQFLPLAVQENLAAEITSTTRYALQGRMPTMEHGMVSSLLVTMMQWNFALKESPCCLYHCAVTACIGVCERLQTVPCHRSFTPYGDEQCMTCGLLLCRGEQCDVCCEGGS